MSRLRVLSPDRFSEFADELAAYATRLALRYAEIHDAGYEQPRYGSGAPGSADGSERDVAKVLAATETVRANLGAASDHLETARRALTAAGGAVARAVTAVDKVHPDAFDPETRTLAEMSLEREAMVDVLERKARHVMSEAEAEAHRLEQRAKRLRQAIARDERKKREARARAEGKTSKGQRRRARHGQNGWNG